MNHSPLPYTTVQQLIDAFNEGAQFVYLTDRSEELDVVDICVSPKGNARARVLDEHGIFHYVLANGVGHGSGKQRLVCTVPVPAPAPQPTTLIRNSDLAGIARVAALPKEALPSAPAAPTKPSAGLLTVANPDDRTVGLWGVFST